MKRLLALMLCLSLLLPVFSLAEDDEDDYDIEDLFDLEDIDLELDENGDLIFPEEEEDEFDINSMDVGPIEEIGAEGNPVDTKELEINENLPDDVINILLIGVDYRTETRKEDQYLSAQMGSKNPGVKRSDVVMILSIDLYEGTLKLTSISRDLLVEIPGHGTNPINYAFAVRHFKNKVFQYSEDKPELLIRTVNHNFELNIQYYVAINFFGVEEIIEYFGGVDVELTKAEANAINQYIRAKGKKMTYDTHAEGRKPLEVKAGVQHLDGLQGLVFGRTRSVSGGNDLQRTGRTRRLLEALLHPAMARVKSMSSGEQLNFIVEMSKYFVTNMNLQAAFSTLWPIVSGSEIMNNLDDATSLIEENRIPGEKGFAYEGAHVKLTNKKKTVQELHEFIYGYYYGSSN